MKQQAVDIFLLQIILQQQQHNLNFIRRPNLIDNYFIRVQQQKQQQQLINIKTLFLFPQTFTMFRKNQNFV
uniref:Uncharacterized protein n=1 Tax=Meloidogyne enterolobii TaxID=390850 RepID=A0A6V7U4M1_MELEN|nr:unnamed protein product [Meloidogyne enterolobii]